MRRLGFARSLTLETGGGSLAVWVAEAWRSRLLGLAGVASVPAGRGLLIPGCASVHTCGMRFAIDVAFVEWPPAPDCAVLRLYEGVGPLHLVRLRGRRTRRTAVIEAPAGTLRALGLDPAGPAVNFK